MLTVGAANLRRLSFAVCNRAQCLLKTFEFRKHDVLGDIAHTAGKCRVKNINTCRSKVNKRRNFFRHHRLHDVHKRTDVMLCLFLFLIHGFRVNRGSNVVEFFRHVVGKLSAHGEMSLDKSNFRLCAAADIRFLRNVF